jgi:hypothetical protein
MYGTEPNKLRLRDDNSSTSSGRSSTSAGPMFEPIVPKTNSPAVPASTERRAREVGTHER